MICNHMSPFPIDVNLKVLKQSNKQKTDEDELILYPPVN